ncbi:MAG: ASKHA domain-containing protein [Pseudomonadota bacterium]
MPSIIFRPLDKSIPIHGPSNLLDLARSYDIPLKSTCGGKKICGKCKIIIEDSDAPLPAPSEHEIETFGDLTQKGYRLACETVLTERAIVRIPEESQSGRQVILTSGTHHPYPARLIPKVESYYVEVPPPVLVPLICDRERLANALAEAYGIKRLRFDLFALRKLPRALRSGHKGIFAVIRDKKELVDLHADGEKELLGMAFDVGTTTVVGYLMSLNTGEKLSVQSALNPQISFGDDVISRISFCQDSPEGLDKLRASIVACLNQLIAAASAEAGIDPARIMEITVAGNTAMHHLFAGLDPRYLAMAPYPPVLQAAEDFKAKELGLNVAPSAYVHLLPLKAGFVGSDTIASILATGIHKSTIETLLIDLGTNGEIVLGNRDRLLCCSTAAGPAFEGGHIRFGMRAAAGAIERVNIDPVTFKVRVKTIHGERARGLCGSGIISAVAEMIRTGIISDKGGFNRGLATPRLRKGKYGSEFVLVSSSMTDVGEDITITEKDVSQLQMAKAAVYAGASLLNELGGRKKIERILLAGAGGNYVDPLDACTIDLFPGYKTATLTGVGNAAIHGACLALLNRNKRKEAERIARKMAYQELAALPRFQELFVENMVFKQAGGV